jgi:hypothetical protein
VNERQWEARHQAFVYTGCQGGFDDGWAAGVEWQGRQITMPIQHGAPHARFLMEATQVECVCGKRIVLEDVVAEGARDVRCTGGAQYLIPQVVTPMRPAGSL